MALASKWDGKCKDCGTPHKAGDMIDQNKNGNWCKNGEQCSGKKENGTTAKPARSIEDKVADNKSMLELNKEMCKAVALEIIPLQDETEEFYQHQGRTILFQVLLKGCFLNWVRA